MRAGFIEKPMKAYFINDAPEPQLERDTDVKIQVRATGICGSEVHAYHGKHPWRVPPVVSGHEFSGVVVETGSAVTTCRPGDRVTAEPQYGCGHCYLCQSGRYNLCPEKKILGASGWSGSFGEYVVLPQQCIVPLPDAVSFAEGALIEPLAVGMHAVRAHHVQETTKVAVIGCGTIGLGVVLSAACFHPATLFGIDVIDFNLEKARSMGAVAAFNSTRDDVVKEIMERTEGKGVDITFLAFGNDACVRQAAEITRPGGTISEIAIMGKDIKASFDLIQVKELHVDGSNMYVRSDYEAVLAEIAAGNMKPSGFITKRFPITQFGEALEFTDKRPEPVVKTLLEF